MVHWYRYMIAWFKYKNSSRTLKTYKQSYSPSKKDKTNNTSRFSSARAKGRREPIEKRGGKPTRTKPYSSAPSSKKGKQSPQNNSFISRKKSVIYLFVITVAYLIFELSFNARLLDVVGGDASMEEIDRIEIYGRVISGIALGLALWGTFIIPFFMKRNFSNAFFSLALVTSMGASIVIMYDVQDRIIEHIVSSSSENERYAAMRLHLLVNATHDNNVIIDNIDLSPENILQPEGKAFMALFPFMAFTVEDLKEKTESAMRQVVRHAVINEVGDSVYFHNEIYYNAVNELYEKYLEYFDGSKEYADVINNIEHEQHEAWNDYKEKLQSNNMTPNSVPRRYFDRVRRDVQQQGIPVSNNWNPGDWQTFYNAIDKKIRSEAKARYERAIKSVSNVQLTQSLPALLSFNEFVSQKDIQSGWKKTLELEFIDDTILATYQYEESKEQIWEKMVSYYTEQKMNMLQSDVSFFRDGGIYEEEGRNAMKALAVPPIALFISLIGGFVHIFKTLNYTMKMTSIIMWIRMPALIILMLMAVSYPLTSGNSMTKSLLYSSFKENTKERFGDAIGGAMTWIIQMQPYAYPANNFIREHILLDFDFGYKTHNSDANDVKLDTEDGLLTIE